MMYLLHAGKQINKGRGPKIGRYTTANCVVNIILLLYKILLLRETAYNTIIITIHTLFTVLHQLWQIYNSQNLLAKCAFFFFRA